MKFLAIFFLYWIDSVLSHSWIACSDYTEKNGEYWDPNKCRGFARDSQKYARKNSFGIDRGFNHRPESTTSGVACKTGYRIASYSSDYPKAVYYPGQQVILAHPMKNHGADICTNLYIPDYGSFIYRGKKNRDRNQKFEYYRRYKVADLGVSKFGYSARYTFRKYPKPGFQNAPKFCENTERALGTYSFNVPKDLEAGEYTFVWSWSFNGPKETYATCFDVIIAGNKAKRDIILLSRNAPLDVVCGGILSNEKKGSTIGCDEFVDPFPFPPKGITTKAPLVTRIPGPTKQPVTTALPAKKGPLVNAFHITGEVAFDSTKSGIKRRYMSVKFYCPVKANFWNARVLVIKNKTNYLLLQSSKKFLGSQKVFFSASYDKPCDMASYLPQVYITFET